MSPSVSANRRRRVAIPGRIRRLGGLVALLVPVTLVAAALALRAWPCEDLGCVQPYSLSWGLLLMAVPTAPLTGVPWAGGDLPYLLAVATAAVMWIIIGRYAAQLSTRDVDAGWREWSVELGSIALGIWLGFAGAAVLALMVTSRF